jgi:hypothetical protein
LEFLGAAFLAAQPAAAEDERVMLDEGKLSLLGVLH